MQQWGLRAPLWGGGRRKRKAWEENEEFISSAPIDPKALQALRDMAGEDAAEVLAEVIDSYLEDAPNCCKQCSRCSRGYHSTVSGSSHPEANECHPCITLSDLQGSRSSGRTGTMADVLAIVLQVEAEYERVQAA